MVNRVFLIGRVGKKPELQTGKSGAVYCRFGLATNGASKDETAWHDVTCLGKTAENLCKFMDKGCIVSVEGSIQYGEYEKDGVKHKTCGIVANAVTFVTYPQRGESQPDDSDDYAYFDDVPTDIPY